MKKEDIELIPVTSTRMRAYGYDPETKVLKIQWKNESIGYVHDVEENVVKSMLSSDSLGKFYEKYIKGAYTYERG
jgi:hypothetical protein